MLLILDVNLDLFCFCKRNDLNHLGENLYKLEGGENSDFDGTRIRYLLREPRNVADMNGCVFKIIDHFSVTPWHSSDNSQNLVAYHIGLFAKNNVNTNYTIQASLGLEAISKTFYTKETDMNKKLISGVSMEEIVSIESMTAELILPDKERISTGSIFGVKLWTNINNGEQLLLYEYPIKHSLGGTESRGHTWH